MQQPLLGPKQPFPQTCSSCGDRFVCGQDVTMKPVIREGEVFCVGKWPHLLGSGKKASTGRVLWYDWLCQTCAEGDGEPLEARLERIEAERSLNMSSSATSRKQRQLRSYGDW